MNTQDKAGRIHILPASVYQKIAAGEVIERPQAVVRELLDNAIDSGASQIDLFLDEGGNRLVAVQDNGSGMGRADLSISWKAHTTSKIKNLDDLYAIRTLGFRGEALSSMASVSKLVIQTHDGSEGGSLTVEGGVNQALVPWSGMKGTRVEVHQLFYNLPARKQFLKRPSTEYQMCRQTFIEKALPHPGIGFRLHKDGDKDLFFPPHGSESLLDRFLEVHPDLGKASFFEVRHGETDFSFRIIASRTELFRHDRKGILIFLNKRRIQEFGLVQALEFAYEGFLPGGRFPYSALYLELEPHLVDVNIHPAKKEVKLLNFRQVHQAIVRHLSAALRQYSLSAPSRSAFSIPEARENFLMEANPFQGTRNNGVHLDWNKQHPPARSEAFPPIVELPRQNAEEKMFIENQAGGDHEVGVPAPADDSGNDLQFFGQVFGVFLLFSRDETLWLMDMHAAHERILYDRFRTRVTRQNLLIPRELELEEDEEKAISRELTRLETMGFSITGEPGNYRLSGLPAIPSIPYQEVLGSLRKALASSAGIEKTFYADLACKAAIKDGEVLDRNTAISLIGQALGLPEKRCPHGRPVFISMTKDELWQAIGRSV